MEKLQTMYKTILGDHFPSTMEIRFGESVFLYEKVGWEIGGEIKGLRYGDNPGQTAALYKPINGNLVLGDVRILYDGKWLASSPELLQSGKHPGKTNITDPDNALNILRYFMDAPVAAIMKHNNPCGVAVGTTLLDAYQKANMADRVAAFGGTIELNSTLDKETAEAIIQNYSEVVVAPDYEEGVLGILATSKNLRVMRIANMDGLHEYIGFPVLEFKTLIDGGQLVQTSFIPQARTLDDIKALPLGYHETKTRGRFEIKRTPTEAEYLDMGFGWLVESGVASNSVLFVKDLATVSIGTGGQDRVGIAKQAVRKAYDNCKDTLCFQETGALSFNELELGLSGKEIPTRKSREIFESLKDPQQLQRSILWSAQESKGGLEGAVAVSDAFFPFRDGVDVCLNEGITAIIQPGGSERDFEAIQACNEAGATMVFTGQRSFKH